MKMENGIFEDNYITNFSQTGIHNVLTNKSFLSLMENIAGAHSAYCHHSFYDLVKKDLSWIILNWKVKVLKRPEANKKIKLKTWGRDYNKAFIFRDFKVLDEDDNVLAIATSKWALMDIKNVKLARMPENLEEIYHGFRDESVFNIKDIEKSSIPKEEAKSEDEYKIRRFDLDINNHVHNLNYLDFAYELLPIEIYTGNELNNLEITYKKEIKYGETIKSFLYEKDGIYTIVIKDKDENKVHAIIKLYN